MASTRPTIRRHGLQSVPDLNARDKSIDVLSSNRVKVSSEYDTLWDFFPTRSYLNLGILGYQDHPAESCCILIANVYPRIITLLEP